MISCCLGIILLVSLIISLESTELSAQTLLNPFVGFYVFPHGGIILDPKRMNYTNEPAYRPESKKKAIKLNAAAKKAAKDLIKSKPDLIILSTPHGFHLSNTMLILNSESGSGSVENFTVNVAIDKDLSVTLFEKLIGANHTIELLTLGNSYQDVPLKWGEVIPFHFVSKAASKAGFELPSVIYIGQPPETNIQHLFNIGRSIARIMTTFKEFKRRRIAVVISGDLSHYHGNSRLNPNDSEGYTPSPYPYNAIGKVFDNFMVKWAKMDRTETTERNSSLVLLQKAGRIQQKSGHCGYNGFVMLHGILNQLVNHQLAFQSHLYAYDVPTYFGMVVCRWTEMHQKFK